tara:strand:+ start:7628 stop:8227 length:600 start_codon:yes stop_codon:yes gene_type:complete
MSVSKGQGDLFSEGNLYIQANTFPEGISISKEFLENWQKRIYTHQSIFFDKTTSKIRQTSLFKEASNDYSIENFSPLRLTPLPINFWKWSESYHFGPAIYIVMDRTSFNGQHLILYIGETIAADKRWKGDHDCKSYLDNYCSALRKAGMSSQLSIRFWTDVPKQTKERRKIEQILIKRWLPPFNKETRSCWQTPFTAEI